MRSFVSFLLYVLAGCIFVIGITAISADLYTCGSNTDDLPDNILFHNAASMSSDVLTLASKEADAEESLSICSETNKPIRNNPQVIVYVLNTNTKKIHYDSCSSVSRINEGNKDVTENFSAAISNGYTPCSICKPIDLNN